MQTATVKLRILEQGSMKDVADYPIVITDEEDLLGRANQVVKAHKSIHQAVIVAQDGRTAHSRIASDR